MNMFSNRFSALMLTLVVAPALVAQESTGTIRGTVRAKGGEALAGVQIRFASTALIGVRNVVTDAQGNYRAPLLPPGLYRLTLTRSGFVTSSLDVQLGLGQVMRQDVNLAAEKEAGATVEVVATSAAAVDKTDVKTSTNITSEQLDVLPRTTRGMETVALLAPGVAVNSAAGGRISIRGAQTTQNRFMLNGTDIADNVFGNSSGRSFYVDDSVEETQVIQSPVHARYGNFTGGVINAITKSGGNTFTGIWRTNLSRTSWSAEAPRGLRPGQVPPNAGTGRTEDLRNASHTLLVGGPIIKDHLWFSVSTKLTPQTSSSSSFSNVAGLTTWDGNAPAYITAFSGQPFQTVSDTKFYEGKLTWGINTNHTVDASTSYSKSTTTDQLQAGSTFDPAALMDGEYVDKYFSVGYRGMLTPSMNLEARYANKRSALGGGGSASAPLPQRIGAAYSNDVTYYFNNGPFNGDAPDNRDTKTATAHLTWFSPETSLGSHMVEAGFEGIRRERQAPNDQTPTGIRLFTSGRNADGTYRMVTLQEDPDWYTAIELGISDNGTAITESQSFYLNDTWTLNNHIQLMGGLRYDKISAEDTLGGSTISSDRISPRFQVTYDPRGDQSWIFRGSWARYVGQLHDGFTNKFTFAGNPIREFFVWKGPTDTPTSNRAATYAEVVDLNNWDISARGFMGVGGALGVNVDPDLKAPYTDEISLSAAHTYANGSYLRFTFSRRESKDQLNDYLFIGDEYDYTVRSIARLNPSSPAVVVSTPSTYWVNDNRIERIYTGAEFEFNFILDRNWSFGGNYTFSRLTGNGEGADSGGRNTSSVGDVLGNYEESHINRNRPMDYYAPGGYLASDQTHRATAHLDYRKAFESGTVFTSSLLFNYNSGGVGSVTRANRFEAYIDANAAGYDYTKYSTTYTRFWGQRGMWRTNDTYNADLKLAVDVPLVSKLRYYLEVTVFNVFNVWQLGSYDTGSVGGSSSYVTDGAKSGFWAQPMALTPGYGYTGFGAYGYGNYTGGRSVVLSTGFKW